MLIIIHHWQQEIMHGCMLQESSYSLPAIFMSCIHPVSYTHLMDIEEVAATRPEAIIREHIDPALGILPFQALKIAVALGLTGPPFYSR